MMSVWVKLYLNKDDQDPSILFIDNFSGNVYQLKEKIKEKEQSGLKEIDADQLNVYPQGTTVPISEGDESIDLDQWPPEGTAF